MRYLVDESTGEIIGADVPVIESAEIAESVLEELSDLDSQIAAVQVRRKALLENLSSIEGRLLHKRTILVQSATPLLSNFVEQNLSDGLKSWVCPFGKVGWRKTRGSVKVLDVSKAIAFLEERGIPEAVKHEPKVLVSNIPDHVKGELPIEAFDVTPPENRFYIETQVNTEK